jgi:hypothetical protein
MKPCRMHANGVRWLYWMGDGRWVCEGCGEAGRQPGFADVAAFARWLGDMKRTHAGCGSEIRMNAGQLGHPLNPDRAER